MLKIENISKKYGKSLILNNISFQLKQGEILTILGKSGIGKSTLLKCICGLEKVDAGEILLNGQDINTINPKELHQKIGIVFQDFNLLDTFSIQDNIVLPLVLSGKMFLEMEERMLPIAKKLGIQHLLDKFPYEISGGQHAHHFRAHAHRKFVGHERFRALRGGRLGVLGRRRHRRRDFRRRRVLRHSRHKLH